MEDGFRGKVVMITGATAGVGRATALAFAREGARLGLIGRDQAALEALRDEVKAMGVRSRIFPVDVADAEAVAAAAQDAEQRLGPIEVWVNNAMTTIFGKIRDLTPEEIRRVTEVTYLGYVHGTLAALAVMGPRDRGTIVQVGSALAWRGIPLQAPYCAAKHAIQGFTETLRTELMHEGSGIRVTMVQLPAINTPQFDWARSKTGRKPRPVAPVLAPEVAGRAILRAARIPRREYWLGASTVKTILGSLLSPALADWALVRGAVGGQKRAAGVQDDRPDNLNTPVTGLHRTAGAFGDEARQSAVLVPASVALLGAAAGGLLAAGLAGAAIGRLWHDRRN
ncbi:SDR family oxidoreductase [Plastorhodobacter daqingensis]|uniref:SDR family oxidoreductase n=1 Tax=Plastorhodobacter daqingensis TaxID=1387281 RepID=A0ABW2ULC5_9RHOB